MKTMDSIINQVRSVFSDRAVYFSSDELPLNIVVPPRWQGFGIGLGEGLGFPCSWLQFSDKFPNTLSLLKTSLIGTFIVVGTQIELGYVFHDASGLYFYMGGIPLDCRPTEVSPISTVTGSLSEFYRQVHDGFTFFPARSMGPQRIEDFTCVADLIDEEDTTFANSWLTIFSNGAGDYVALDVSSQSQDKGIIWWHEQPMDPELDVDIFEVMDAWMSIFLEDTLPREDVLFQRPNF